MNNSLPVILQDIPLGLSKNLFDKYQSFDEKQDLYSEIKKFSAASSWMMADFFKYLWEDSDENTLTKFAKSVGESEGTVNNYIRTAKGFTEEQRNPMASFSHHFQAMQADPYDRKTQIFKDNSRFEWLSKAIDQRWTTRKLNEEIMRKKKVKELGTALPCDWCQKIDEDIVPFNFYNSKTKHVDHMSFHEICYQELLAYAKNRKM